MSHPIPVDIDAVIAELQLSHHKAWEAAVLRCRVRAYETGAAIAEALANQPAPQTPSGGDPTPRTETTRVVIPDEDKDSPPSTPDLGEQLSRLTTILEPK